MRKDMDHRAFFLVQNDGLARAPVSRASHPTLHVKAHQMRTTEDDEG